MGPVLFQTGSCPVSKRDWSSFKQEEVLLGDFWAPGRQVSSGVVKEGGKRGVEIEGAADMGGLQSWAQKVPTRLRRGSDETPTRMRFQVQLGRKPFRMPQSESVSLLCFKDSLICSLSYLLLVKIEYCWFL